MTTATLTTKHPHSLGLWLARGLWLLTLVIVLAIGVEILRHDYRIDIRYAWSVQEAQDAVVHVMPFATYVNLIFAVRVAAGAVFTLAGILVFWRRVDDLFGIFVAGSLVLWALPFALGVNLDELAVPALLAPVAPWLAGLITGCTLVTFVLFYFLFPDGRFVPRWMRWVALTPLAVICALIVIPPLEQVVHVAWPAAPEDLIWTTFMTLLLFTPLIGLVGQIQRYRLEQSALRRQQTQWVLWGLAAVWLSIVVVFLFMPAIENLGTLPKASAYALENLAMPLVMTLIPLSILFSIFRYRLWDSGVWLNRTLVYGTLTVLIAALYAAIVGLLGLFFQGSGNALLAVVATGVVAVLISNIFDKLQVADRAQAIIRARQAGLGA